LLDAYGNRTNWRLGAAQAKSITDSFDGIYSRITAAKRVKRIANSSDKMNLTSIGALSLNDYIQRLDKEDADRKLSILAVDDSPVILNSVSSVLSSYYKVYTLPKPLELVKVLQKLTPELFLLDYQMPELSGFDLIPIIRSMPEHADTPIIFLTSIGTLDNVTAALALGASDFVVKPFDPEILREKISKHIVRKKLF
jgi:PleD family two-component response regulator